jgi:hypothetical protein
VVVVVAVASIARHSVSGNVPLIRNQIADCCWDFAPDSDLWEFAEGGQCKADHPARFLGYP